MELSRKGSKRCPHLSWFRSRIAWAAKRRRAASSIPVLKVDEERWEDNRMIFRVRALGQAASGHLDVADDHVRLEVMLPWLLQRFAEAAQTAIRNRGNLLLTKRN